MTPKLSDRRRTIGIIIALILAACTESSNSVEQSAPGEITATLENTVTIGQSGFEIASENSSPTFQRAIDYISENGGGTIIVPEGIYQIRDLALRSGVSIIFESGVTIKPGKGSAANLINCGHDGTAVKGVGIYGPPGQLKVDFSGADVAPEVSRLRFLRLGDCEGFKVSNIDIVDNFSVFSGIILGWDGEADGRSRHARNGIIENMTSYNAHYGYGAIQAHAGENITFKNIRSFGGVAVRLETGLVPMNLARSGKLDRIFIDGAYSEKGQAALMLQAHTINHGSVVAKNISSEESEFAVSIASPFVSKSRYSDADGLTPGKFESIKIDGVKSVYGDGPITTRFSHLRHYPPALHDRIKRVPGGISQPEFRGPSIAAISLQDERTETIEITNIEAIGFDHHPDIITKKNLFRGSIRNLAGKRRSPRAKSLHEKRRDLRQRRED